VGVRCGSELRKDRGKFQGTKDVRVGMWVGGG
jgi:hypothetical protein